MYRPACDCVCICFERYSVQMHWRFTFAWQSSFFGISSPISKTGEMSFKYLQYPWWLWRKKQANNKKNLQRWLDPWKSQTSEAQSKMPLWTRCGDLMKWQASVMCGTAFASFSALRNILKKQITTMQLITVIWHRLRHTHQQRNANVILSVNETKNRSHHLES